MQLWRLGESKNLMRPAGKLEIQERFAIQVQWQSARKPGRCDVADEVRRQSARKFPVASKRTAFYLMWAFK